MAVDGGHWTWTASLRFYWMLPIMLIIVLLRKNSNALWREIQQNYWQWILWSSIGFGVFYAGLSYAASTSPSWLVASTWQFTIVAGMLLTPLLQRGNKSASRIGANKIIFSALILLGIFIMQWKELKQADSSSFLWGTSWILIAAFAYPLGNRKMMQLTDGRIDTYQRILGMIICSLPFWLLLTAYGYSCEGAVPTDGQLVQSLLVAVFSGVIATSLFFYATDSVRQDPAKLASVEATQSAEVLFALAGEMLLFGTALPNWLSMLGIALVIIGMGLHSLSK